MQLEKNIRTLESILTFYKYIYTGELRKIFYVELKCVLFPLSRITIWKKKRDLYVLWISIYIDKNISKQNIDLVSSFVEYSEKKKEIKEKIISNVDPKVVLIFRVNFQRAFQRVLQGGSWTANVANSPRIVTRTSPLPPRSAMSRHWSAKRFEFDACCELSIRMSITISRNPSLPSIHARDGVEARVYRDYLFTRCFRPVT